VSDLPSALIVVVPEAAGDVDDWSERTATAKPSTEVPAHVTILFPFIPAHEIDDAVSRDLWAIFARAPAFGFTLRQTQRFPGVLYLAPEPPEPFVSLTEAVIAWYPGYPPYGGEFQSIVPHLTAAEGDPEILDEAEADIRRSLPIASSVRDVMLLEEVEPSFGRWRPRETFPLGAA